VNDLQSQANKEKVKHGQQNEKTIEALMESLQKDGIISSFKKEIHVKKHGFEYPEQYLANYLITTFDGKYIVVRRTTSHRDRVKIYNYDIEGILENSDYSNNIVASIYLLPNDQLENKTFLGFQERIRQKIEYSPFTHCLVHDQFKEFLENLRSSTIEKIEYLDEDPFFDEQQPFNGSASAKRGIAFEKAIVRILNTEGELQKYKKGASEKALSYFPMYSSIFSVYCSLSPLDSRWDRYEKSKSGLEFRHMVEVSGSSPISSNT
jgi:hypothetical protein